MLAAAEGVSFGSRHAARDTAAVLTCADLIPTLADMDQQIAGFKDAIADPTTSPADCVQALLDMAALKTMLANVERSLRLCTE